MRTHRNRVLNPSILHISPWDPQPKETYPQKPIAKWETNTNFIKVEQVPQTPTLLKGGLQKKVRSSSKALSSPWSLNLGMTSCLSRVWVCVPNCLNNMPSLPYSPRGTGENPWEQSAEREGAERKRKYFRVLYKSALWESVTQGIFQTLTREISYFLFNKK